MKREFYKRLYFFELKTRRALDVFRLSLSRVKSYDLFNAVVQRLAPEDLAKFLELVEGTTYDLSRTCIADLLYRIPFTRQAYDAFCRLDVGPLRVGHPPLLGVYNYCHYKRSTGDYRVDIAANEHGEMLGDGCGDPGSGAGSARCCTAPGDGGTKRPCTEMGRTPAPGDQEPEHGGAWASPMIYPQDTGSGKAAEPAPAEALCRAQPEQAERRSHSFVFTGLAADELREMRGVLKEMCVRNRGHEVLKTYVRIHVKDELLQAILDENGRVNGALHPARDLLLLRANQVYGLSEAKLLEMELCRAWCVDGECVCCQSRVFVCPGDGGAHSQENNARSQVAALSPCRAGTNAEPPRSGALSAEMVRAASGGLETALLEEELGAACGMLLHCRELCTARVLRVVLRLYAAHRSRPALEHCGHNARPRCPVQTLDDRVAEVVDSFDITPEVEDTVISFLKSRSCSFEKVLSLIPALMKSRHLYFACFAAMIDEALSRTNPYWMMRMRALVHRHERMFGSIADMVIAYYYDKRASSAGIVAGGVARKNGAPRGIAGRKSEPGAHCLVLSLDAVDHGDAESDLGIDHDGHAAAARRRPFCLEEDEPGNSALDAADNGLAHTEDGLRTSSPDSVHSTMGGASVRKLLLENEPEGRAAGAPPNAPMDYDYLHAAFAGLAEMHSMPASDFVRRYFFNIFISVHTNRRYFTEAFLARNGRYILIKRIMEGAPAFECNNVDVMVGLMFNGNFSLSHYFKPSPRDFIQRNLSQLLFRIKSAYRSGDYNYVHGASEIRRCEVAGKNHVVYGILRHILSSVQIPLYFNYIWPTIEYFLNKEECECGMDFVDWLRCEYYSPLMVPYMRVPFVAIGDLPVIPGIESKLYYVLLRFFGSQGSGAPDALLRGEAALGSPLHPQHHTLDEYFVENFLSHYCSNATFRNKILDLYPSCSPRTKALFGSLRTDHRRAIFMKAPEDVPRFILEHFLLRIDYNHQELYSFVIQEFLKNISGPLNPEVENIVGQFRHTRYELQDEKARLDCERIGGGVCVDSSYADFLRSLLGSLCGRLTGHGYLRYLVLFDTDILEYSCLCLIKICHDEVPGFALDGLLQAVNGYYKDFAGADYEEMLRFMLKINMFAGAQLCSKRDCLNYTLVLRDYYGVIQLLDGAVSSECEGALLQLAYYMVGDNVRVKELNKQNLIYSAIALFFEFATEWNFRAARQCYDGYLKQNICAAVGPVLGTEPGHAAVAGVMKEILDTNDAEEGAIDEDNAEYGRALLESCAYSRGDLGMAKDGHGEGRAPDSLGCGAPGSSSRDGRAEECNTAQHARTSNTGIQLHGCRFMKHQKGLAGGCKDRNYMLHISMDCHLIQQSKDLGRTLDIITRRRSIAENKECIMRMHRALASCLGMPGFLKTVELEFIRSLRRKRDYASCMRCIAKLVLRQEWEALYELALMKLDQKCHSEAKELLGRVISLCTPGDEAYYKAIVKLCELSNDTDTHAQYIRVVEESLLGADCGADIAKRAGSGGPSGRTIIDAGRCTSDAVPSQAQLNERQGLKNFVYLQRLYFLAAQLLENTELLRSLSYYQRSFNNNYGAVPRFFHLIARLPHSHLPRVEKMVSDTVRHNLAVILPYYSQISNRLSIQTDSFKLYNMAIRAMLETAPQETFWDTLILVNSRREDIRTRIQALIDGLSLENRVLFRSTQRIAEQFMQISRSKSKTIAMDDFKLRRLLPSDVSVPGRRAKIHGVRDEIVVFVSLQRPKKIVLVGDDGVEYPMIVKYKDDLRKDSRMMEMGMLLNKLFDDGYYIRNYRVIPFSHDVGIIEYVPGLISLKGICTQFYTHINEVATSFAKHRRVGGNNMERILKMFPPVLHGWMKQQYPDPYAFYIRRENYIRTYAIMCIVGWFIGLGDRHAENTHFDLATGDTVHVDLNCIFDKGLTFEIPERVPFRLTQNIVDGFGCLKLEGPFRKTMHYALRVMKANKDVILSNLLSFLFDPLFEWARKKNEPERILEVLGDRLNFENEEEMTSRMIQEAMSLNNLGSMYIGWMPFL